MLTQLLQTVRDPQGGIILVLVTIIVSLAATSIARLFFHHLNIRKAGWPPAHLDADGDQPQDSE